MRCGRTRARDAGPLLKVSAICQEEQPSCTTRVEVDDQHPVAELSGAFGEVNYSGNLADAALSEFSSRP